MSPTHPPIRILLADDHPIVRDGIRKSIARRKGMRVVGESSDGRDVLSKVKQLSPDVLLLDLTLPKMNGVDVVKALRKMSSNVRVIIFTVHAEKEFVVELVHLGVSGYLLKECPTSEVIEAIEKASRGEVHYTPAATQQILGHLVKSSWKEKTKRKGTLTPRETEVLIAVAEGLSNEQIAGRMKLSKRTVQTYRERIMQKLDIHTATGLTRYAIRRGIVET